MKTELEKPICFFQTSVPRTTLRLNGHGKNPTWYKQKNTSHQVKSCVLLYSFVLVVRTIEMKYISIIKFIDIVIVDKGWQRIGIKNDTIAWNGTALFVSGQEKVDAWHQFVLRAAQEIQWSQSCLHRIARERVGEKNKIPNKRQDFWIFQAQVSIHLKSAHLGESKWRKLQESSRSKSMACKLCRHLESLHFWNLRSPGCFSTWDVSCDNPIHKS